MDTLKKIGLTGLVPVVAFDSIDQALPAAKAIQKSGIEVIEVTLRTEAGLDAIKKIRESMPDMLVGAGTVLTVKNAQDAIEAGASFIVTPGFSQEVVKYCKDSNIPVTPGCVTPTEITMAIDMGLITLKFFPASTYGGIKACNALMGPFKHTGLSFIPTGGISQSNLSEYADKPFIHAIGGGWLCDSKSLKNEDYDNIFEVCKESVDTLLGFEVDHLGINSTEDESTDTIVSIFDRAFNLGIKRGNSSDFAGKNIEVVKDNGRGKNGHVAIRTNNLDRAVYYLGKRGYTIDEESLKIKNGKKIAVYLNDLVGGFAIHLLQK